ncbi:SseB family protein [Streptomyces lavendulae]|uniref:SseB family protein n=1 Tax=Streptomyces lavendulae TaxID=1914 RepID=UPI0025521DC4|nr:SseB family protein [Streptomyces lavendulae]
MGFDEEWAQLRAAAAARLTAGPGVTPGPVAVVADPLDAVREAAGTRLAAFRRQLVLVPLDTLGGLWTAQLGGLDWICAFSGEETFARFAEARGEAGQEWAFRRVAGARLLDEVIPELDFPCGVALDAAGPDGAVFPPVRGIVPDAAALDGEVAA